MFKVIVSAKYIGPTNNRGSRYRLKMAGAKAKFISYGEFNDAPHIAVEKYLMEVRSGRNHTTHFIAMEAVSNPDDNGPDLYIVNYYHKPRSAA